MLSSSFPDARRSLKCYEARDAISTLDFGLGCIQTPASYPWLGSRSMLLSVFFGLFCLIRSIVCFCCSVELEAL